MYGYSRDSTHGDDTVRASWIGNKKSTCLNEHRKQHGIDATHESRIDRPDSR